MVPLIGESFDFSFYFSTAVQGLNRTVLYSLESFVFIILQMFFAIHAVLKLGEYFRYRCMFRPIGVLVGTFQGKIIYSLRIATTLGH